MQQNAQTFFAQTEAATSGSLPQFIKDEFDVFLECGILPHGFLRVRVRYSECGNNELFACG